MSLYNLFCEIARQEASKKTNFNVYIADFNVITKKINHNSFEIDLEDTLYTNIFKISLETEVDNFKIIIIRYDDIFIIIDKLGVN